MHACASRRLKDCLIEREVLAKIRSPFCVNLHYAYDDKTNIYLTLTLCPGGGGHSPTRRPTHPPQDAKCALLACIGIAPG